MVDAQAPIDGFGVGTKMGVSADAPWLDMAYKLVRYEGRPVLKLSTGKVSLVDEKEVYRRSDSQGMFVEDIIALRGEVLPVPVEPLLARVMEGGRIASTPPTLEEVRRRFQEEFARLPEGYKALQGAPAYPVRLSPGLQSLQEQTERQVGHAEGHP